MWITGSRHWEGHWRLQSLVTGSHGVTGSRSHLGAHCPATPQSWMGRLPAVRSSFPATSRPQSAEGVGRRDISFCPKGLSRNRTLLVLLRFCPMTTSILAASVSHVCAPHHSQRPHPHFSHLPSPGDELHHLPQILSSPHPLPPLSLPLSPQLAASAHPPAQGCS